MTDEVKNETDTKTEVPEVKSDVAKMSDEDIKWRAKYKMTKSEYEEAKLAAEKEKNELLSKVEATTKERHMLESKVIEAELKAHAVAAGIKDLDFIKLIDVKDVKMNEAGVVEGLDKLVQDFKARKPDLFGIDKKVSSSTNAPAGDKMPTRMATIDARNMSKDDWKRNKSRYMRGNFS